VAGLVHVQNGNHVIISSKTSSGKSLVYQLPILKGLYESDQYRALAIFPTKALTQDQKISMERLLSKYISLKHMVDIFDGDTDKKRRADIRESARIIFTNPDMLHVSILPNHCLWKHFFSRLRIVVVDELHTYSGTFGLHCSFIMRRLQRICNYYGNHALQFICCTATISNPKEVFFSF
jgi:DEAD/DEAH box helicase domain-containing protein